MDWWVYVAIVAIALVCYIVVVDIKTSRGLKEKKARERAEYKRTHKKKKRK